MIVDDLDPIFHASRLSTIDFIQMWQLIDIKHGSINKQQFIYLMHILASRKRGLVPTGLPLDIKQQFLKEVGYFCL